MVSCKWNCREGESDAKVSGEEGKVGMGVCGRVGVWGTDSAQKNSAIAKLSPCHGAQVRIRPNG